MIMILKKGIRIFSKIFEGGVFQQLRKYFEDNNILSLSQFGFSPGRNTLNAIDHLLKVIYNTYKAKVYALAMLFK